MDIAGNVRSVRARIAAAAEASGRRPEEIALCAATKMNDAARVREAVAAGVDAAGENRVQELAEKKAQGAYDGTELHFIGHLQRNKVRQVVGEAKLIQSVDSEELLRLISARASALGITQDILIEVNIGGEQAKSGVAPAETERLLEAAAQLEAIRVRGLMTVPPAETEKGGSAAYFRAMHKLFVDIRAKKYNNVSMEILSMGMTADFEEAIACGATMVRVGSAIFGERHYAEKEQG